MTNVSFLNLHCELRQVGGRGPHAGRGHRWVAKGLSSFAGGSIAGIWFRRFRPQALAKRYLEGAVRHSERFEYEVLHQFRERLVRHIAQQQLNHDITATGIAKFFSGCALDADRLVAGGCLTVQNLHRSWQWVTGEIPSEAGYVQPGSMA